MNGRGRPRGSNKECLVLLDYRSWRIEYDASAWPSVNYILRKKESDKVAYCVSLESALKSLYDEMIVDYVNRINGYGGKFSDLANAITTTKNEISALLDAQAIKKLKENGENSNVRH